MLHGEYDTTFFGYRVVIDSGVQVTNYRDDAEVNTGWLLLLCLKIYYCLCWCIIVLQYLAAEAERRKGRRNSVRKRFW
jgi:hypothetical protein